MSVDPRRTGQTGLPPWWLRLLLWGFDRLYQEAAWAYDLVALAVSGGRWFSWGRASLPYLQGRVLELGFGTGHLLLALVEQHLPVVGIDRSAEMCRITRARLRRAGFSAPIMRATGQALPFPAAQFDTVVATFPAGYIVQRATLQEVRRVLAAGGRLVLVDAAQFERPGVYERVLGLAYRLTGQQIAAAEQIHELAYEPLLRAAGFSVRVVWEQVAGSRVALVIGSCDEPAGH